MPAVWRARDRARDELESGKTNRFGTIESRVMGNGRRRRDTPLDVDFVIAVGVRANVQTRSRWGGSEMYMRRRGSCVMIEPFRMDMIERP